MYPPVHLLSLTLEASRQPLPRVPLQTMGVSSELENAGSWSFAEAEPHQPPSSWHQAQQQQQQQEQEQEPLAWLQQPQQQGLSPWHHPGQHEDEWLGAGAGEVGSPLAETHESWPSIGQSQEDADLQAAVQVGSYLLR
mgnify:CR=1 FL=1